MPTLKTPTKTQTTATVFHPILIGVYSSVAFLANNIVQLNPVYALRTIVFSLLLSAAVFGLVLLIIRDKFKAGLLASLALFLFTIYGHIYNLVENKTFIGHHRYILGIWVLLFAVGAWFILRAKKKPLRLTFFLNVFSVVLIAMPFYQIVSFELVTPSLNAPKNPAVDQAWQPSAPAAPGSPDVYYIILDAYSRADILQKYYDYDNSKFLQELRDRGFYVVDCSLSNYNETVTSISSTLNMDYLDNFAGSVVIKKLDFHRLGGMIKHSKVRELFEALGYKTVTFETSYWWLDSADSDLYITQYPSPWQKILNFKFISDFEKDYINTTALRAAYEIKLSMEHKFGKVMLSPEKAHYEMVQFNLEQLNNLPSTPGPKFVYAHLVAPHFPYVFTVDGSFQYEEADNPGYLNEMTYINTRILEVIDSLIQNSKTPPVIILQGDHGVLFEKRNANLNAYYFPGTQNEMFYPTITPVNSFRLVFDTYFGAKYPLLKDVARHSTYQDPFDFKIYEDQCDVSVTK